MEHRAGVTAARRSVDRGHAYVAASNANVVRRQFVNRFMGAVVMLLTLIALLPLLLLIVFIVINGASGFNISLLTQLPKPVGELGGGMANAFVGTGILIVDRLSLSACR